MKRHFILLAFSILVITDVFAIQSGEIRADSINDGPYIFKPDNKIEAKWVENGILKAEHVNRKSFSRLKEKFNLLMNYREIKKSFDLKPEYSQQYSGVDSISAISDIHGEYNGYIDLLRSSGIIDDNLNWSFGTGHLVVIGDIFDRGDNVTEVMWHLFGLEKQALKAGGMVHVLLGNHEILVLSEDLRYMNPKYTKVEEIINASYVDLYSEKSVLGNWLRYRPAMISINDIIFVHGGISKEVVLHNLKIEQINWFFSQMLLREKMNPETDNLMFLYESGGPVWYRGYFADTPFHETQLDSILNFYGKKHIVVGHTPFHDIKSLYNNKILGIDAGLGYDLPGALLIYKNGTFYKSSIEGNRSEL